MLRNSGCVRARKLGGVLTFDTDFERISVQRFEPRQCRQDLGRVAGWERCGGQLEAGKAAVHSLVRP